VHIVCVCVFQACTTHQFMNACQPQLWQSSHNVEVCNCCVHFLHVLLSVCAAQKFGMARKAPFYVEVCKGCVHM